MNDKKVLPHKDTIGECNIPAKLLDEKLLSLDGEEIDHDVAIALATYLKNEYKLLREDKSSGFFNGNGNRQQQQQQQGEREDEDERLAAAENKLTTEDIDFVINTMKKEARYDELSIRQLLCGMCSAFTKRPIHHIVNSKESGAGKNYLLELVSRYFPDKYVIPLSNMSDKALFHRKGILVVRNIETGQEQSVAPILNALDSEIDDLQAQIEDEKNKEPKSRNKNLIRENKKRIREIESEIKDIESRAEKLIDLNNQIILCLDTPQDSLYDAIMSIVSQDTPKDQHYSFVDKTSSGKLITKDNMMRGTPAIFPTQVIDDTRTQRFQEKNRRFINVTPDTSNEKICAAKDIIALQGGYLPEEYDDLVVSRRDKERAKQIVSILVAKLKQHTKNLEPKQHGVKILFALSITRSIPNSHVWSMTVADRTIKYLSIITKVHMDARPKLVNEQTGQFYPIATFEDLKETLKLMQVGASGVRPYIAKWFNDVFIPAFRDLGDKPNEDKDDETGTIIIKKEKHVGLTIEQLTEKTKEILGGQKLSSGELRNKYLYPLINQGIIDKVQSEINGSQNIYFPVEEEGNIFSIFEDPDNPKLKVSNPDIFPSKSFLNEEFRILSKHDDRERVVFEKNISCYKLVDTDGSEITVDQLLEKYFDNPEECFVKACKYREEDNNSNNDDNNGYGSTSETLSKAAATNNILYQQQVIQKQKNIYFSHPSPRRVFTEFSKNDIEEFFKDNPDVPWYMPSHDLDQSPCCHIIHKKGEFYSCKLHPKEANSIYLDAVEQHCKYKDPDGHKAELLKQLNLSETNNHVEKTKGRG